MLHGHQVAVDSSEGESRLCALLKWGAWVVDQALGGLSYKTGHTSRLGAVVDAACAHGHVRFLSMQARVPSVAVLSFCPSVFPCCMISDAAAVS